MLCNTFAAFKGYKNNELFSWRCHLWLVIPKQKGFLLSEEDDPKPLMGYIYSDVKPIRGVWI
jgi:hypothetical protein